MRIPGDVGVHGIGDDGYLHSCLHYGIMLVDGCNLIKVEGLVPPYSQPWVKKAIRSEVSILGISIRSNMSILDVLGIAMGHR